MAWLFEDPSTVLMAGALILVLLGVVLHQTGQARVLLAMTGVLVVMLICLVIEIAVVTDREEVENTLYRTAELVEANDVAGVLAHVAPEAVEMRNAVEANFSRWTVTEARIANLTINVNPNAVPPTAQVELIGRVSVDDPRNKSPYRNAVRRFTIQLRREGDTWQMVSYGERDVR
jgi:ketosteroid isomerase-like protein